MAQHGFRVARFVGLLVSIALSAESSMAQNSAVFTVLHSFTGGADGGSPYLGGLVQGSDGNFYGTTQGGGTNRHGTVFKITATGTLSTLHSFTGGADGASPQGRLVQGSDGYLYGTAFSGGTRNWGTVFKISTTGTLTPLHSFTHGDDGASPWVGLVQGSDGDFYGTTEAGGSIGYGTIFKITTTGTLSTLYPFTGGADGRAPHASLELGNDGNFYGTTASGGARSYGTVFQMSPSGALTTLYSFTGHANGGTPSAGLVLGIGGSFYGTTHGGSTYGVGTVFNITSDGLLTTLHAFTGGADGGYPQARLVRGADGNIYGTTQGGGIGGNGTVFKMDVTGALTTLYKFTGGTDGGQPNGLVQGIDGNLYGTTYVGGGNGSGVVFRVLINSSTNNPPLQLSGAGLAGGGFLFNLSGPVGAVVILQTKDDLDDPVWTSVSTNTLAIGTAFFIDFQFAERPHRFYRVQTQ